MNKMVFISLPIEDLQTVITDCVNSCLKHNKPKGENSNTPTDQPKQWLDLNDLVKYDPEKRTKPTWYSKISKGEVPNYKKGKKVYFLKSEIDEFLKAGKRKTIAELEQEADEFLCNKKGSKI